MEKQDFEDNKKYQIDSVNIFLTFRLFFIRKPVPICIFKILMKPVSIILFKIQIRKILRKKLVKIFSEKKKRFHIKLNFRQKLIKDLYRIRLVFPETRFNFFRFFPFTKNQSNCGNHIFKSYGDDGGGFFQKKRNSFGYFPGLQKLIILKVFKAINYFYSDKNVIQYLSFSKFCFTSFFLKTSIFLTFLEKNFSKLFFQKTYFKNCFYQLFEIKDYNVPTIFDLKFETCYDTLLHLNQKFNNFNLKLTHSYENYSINFNLFLFCEFGSFFTPRISDKMFFKIHRLYFFQKGPSFPINFVKKKICLNKKNLFKIIIETNFRVYAYKKKKTEIDILEQFSETLYILPNLFVGDLTVKSMNKALKNGISGENILSFLQDNLHQVCKKIPKNVIEQIKIWDLEKKKNFICKVILASNVGKIGLQNFKNKTNQSITVHKRKNFRILIFERPI
jgi:hypothetical protein